MSLFSLIFGNKPKTAHLAKERLQLIIAHERDGGGSSANFLPDLQRELIAVISTPMNRIFVWQKKEKRAARVGLD